MNDKGKVNCKVCQKSVKVQGLGSHMRMHNKKKLSVMKPTNGNANPALEDVLWNQLPQPKKVQILARLIKIA